MPTPQVQAANGRTLAAVCLATAVLIRSEQLTTAAGWKLFRALLRSAFGAVELPGFAYAALAHAERQDVDAETVAKALMDRARAELAEAKRLDPLN